MCVYIYIYIKQASLLVRYLANSFSTAGEAHVVSPLNSG